MELKFGSVIRYTRKPPLGPVKELDTEKVDFSYETTNEKWEERSRGQEEKIRLDRMGRIIEVTLYFQKHGKIQITNHFGVDGKLAQAIFNELDDPSSSKRIIYSYDEQSNRIETIYSANDTELEKSKLIYTYDERGNLKTFSRYCAQGIVLGIVSTCSKYTYASDGSWGIETLSYNQNGALESEVKEFYQANSKTKETVSVSQGKFLLKTISHFDELGNEIERAFYKKDGSLFEKVMYDLEGDITMHFLVSSQGEYIEENKYTYEYDQYGNWIKKTLVQTIKEPDKAPYQRRMDLNRTITYWDEA